MPPPKLSKLELKIMEALWSKGPSSVREIQESFPAKLRPAYTTVQTIVYRLEAKNAMKRTKKIDNAHIFEAVVSQPLADVDAPSALPNDRLGERFCGLALEDA